MRAQVDDDLFLASVERGLQPVRRVAAVLDGAALAPLADGELAYSEALGELGLGAVRLLDRQARRWRGRGVLVQVDQHAGLRCFKSASSPLSPTAVIEPPMFGVLEPATGG